MILGQSFNGREQLIESLVDRLDLCGEQRLPLLLSDAGFRNGDYLLALLFGGGDNCVGILLAVLTGSGDYLIALGCRCGLGGIASCFPVGVYFEIIFSKPVIGSSSSRLIKHQGRKRL